MKTRMILIVAATLLSPLAYADKEPETKRDVVVEKHDANGDKRLDGKEMKTFKKENPKMYAALVEFCGVAKDAPKKNGVELPKDPTKKQLQCKKKHVSRLFLHAWTADGKPLDGGPGPGDGGQPSRSEDGGPR